MANLFDRPNQGEYVDIYTVGKAINKYNEISGSQTANELLYAVPTGKKFVCMAIFSTIKDGIDVTASLVCRDSGLHNLFIVDKDYALNTNFLNITDPLFEAGTQFHHFYESNDVGDKSRFTILGVEING